MSDRTERVKVKMSPECKAVLKSYAETYGLTMADALHQAWVKTGNRKA